MLSPTKVTDKLANMVWYLGVRLFRLTRKINLSSKLEPVFAKLAGLIPSSARVVIAVLPNGARLSMPPGYRDSRTVVTGLFQADETKLFERLTRPGMTFLDIGAYVGYFTILASGLVGSAGRVYAFEPDAFAYEYLAQNIDVNNCGNVVAINKAVSDCVTTVALVRDPKGPESFVTNEPADADSIVVETVSLDSFFEIEKWPKIDIVKMNIEGSELRALRGMKEAIRRNRGLQLVMEFNPSAIARAGLIRDDLAVTLAELGFRNGQIVERDLQALPSGELLPRGGAVYNILLTQ